MPLEKSARFSTHWIIFRFICVGSAGVAADDVKLARDEVRHLTLALVAPLRTHEN